MGWHDVHTVAVRPQDALDFSVCLVQILDVFHHIRREDDIEGAVPERDVAAIVIGDGKETRLSVIGIRNFDRSNVDTTLEEIERLVASARANLEDPCTWSEESNDLVDLCCTECMQMLYREHTASASVGWAGRP